MRRRREPNRRSTLALAFVGLLALPTTTIALTVTIDSGLSTSEAAAEYQRQLTGDDGVPPQIVESACEERFGGRICPELAPGSAVPGITAGTTTYETSGRWFFIPPLPVADTPSGPRLGDDAAGTDGAFDGWLVRRTFTRGAGAGLDAWRRQAAEGALVDCTVLGCQLFAFAAAADRPADEEWLLKCWVEVADGVRGAPYGCRQVAAIAGDVVWLRALKTWSEMAVERRSPPPFEAAMRCPEPLPDAARVIVEALEAPPLSLAARDLLAGTEVVAVAAPRTSPLLAAVAEWPSFRLRLVEAQQGDATGRLWAYGLELDQHLVTATVGSGVDADWLVAGLEARQQWERRLREVASGALAAACARASAR